MPLSVVSPVFSANQVPAKVPAVLVLQAVQRRPNQHQRKRRKICGVFLALVLVTSGPGARGTCALHTTQVAFFNVCTVVPVPHTV